MTSAARARPSRVCRDGARSRRALRFPLAAALSWAGGGFARPAGRTPIEESEVSSHTVVRQTAHEQREKEAERRAQGPNFGWDAIVAKVMDPARRPQRTTREMDQRA